MSLIGSFFVGMSLIILVVVMSVMDGFQQRLKNTISGSSAEYILVPRFPSDFERLAKAVEEQVPQIKVASPFHETVSFVQRSGPQDPIRDKLEFAKVSGIDGWREQSVNDFGKFIQGNDKPADVADPSVMRPPGTSQSTALVQGVRDIREPFKVYSELDERSGTKGVIIGWGLQRTLRVKVGEKIKIASIRRKVGTNPDSIESADFDIRWLRYIVVGTYLSGNGDTDAQCIFMDHKVVEELWSPDGRRLVYRVWGGTETGLRIMNLADRSVRLLTTGYDNVPYWSPTEERIVFTRKADNNFDVYTIRPDGTDLRRLTTSLANDGHAVWTTDGKHILYSSGQPGWKDEAAHYDNTFQPYAVIMMMRADGSEKRQLTDSLWEDSMPCFVPQQK